MADTTTVATEIGAWLTARGWKRSEDGFVDRHYEHYVDLSGDFAPWVLKDFTDGDIDGVAVGRWVESGYEGDTFDELRAAVESLGWWNRREGKGN